MLTTINTGFNQNWKPALEGGETSAEEGRTSAVREQPPRHAEEKAHDTDAVGGRAGCGLPVNLPI